MTIKIVDFPINSMVMFNSYVKLLEGILLLMVMFIHVPLIELQPKGLNYPSSWLGMNIQYEEDIFLSDKQDSSGSRPCWILRPIPRMHVYIGPYSNL